MANNTLNKNPDELRNWASKLDKAASELESIKSNLVSKVDSLHDGGELLGESHTAFNEGKSLMYGAYDNARIHMQNLANALRGLATNLEKQQQEDKQAAESATSGN